MTENPLVAILLTKLESQNLLNVLSHCEEQHKLRNKVMACDIALHFLQSDDSPREFHRERAATISRTAEVSRIVELHL